MSELQQVLNRPRIQGRWKGIRNPSMNDTELDLVCLFRGYRQGAVSLKQLLRWLVLEVRLHSRRAEKYWMAAGDNLNDALSVLQQREYEVDQRIQQIEAERRFLSFVPRYIPVDTLRDMPTNREYVYLLHDISNTKTYKIGKAVKPYKRLHKFEVVLPMETGVVCLLPTQDAYKLESAMHEKYAHRHNRGEWYALTDAEVIEFMQHPGAIHVYS